MSNGAGMKLTPVLVHVHRCAGCGTRTRRSRLNGPDSLLGLYECPGCGQKGPLNIEIVEQAVLED
jgi:predicted RNA-binding Zn-ribbon protein involved in translation (DUF1610 family)